MGILKSTLYGLIYAAEKHGVHYTQTLMVGRQGILVKSNLLRNILREYNPAEKYTITTGCGEDLFRYFGADTVDSIDYSDYEGATIIHDLNLPVEESLKNKYTCVFDGGCLEHVFNYPVAIRNCMDMTAINGHLILHAPANNQFGHGFYQFSSELFFSLLNEQNGFSETKIYMQDNGGHWVENVSPLVLNRRVEVCCSSKPDTLMFVISKKTAPVPVSLTVLQSDYIIEWNTASGNDNAGGGGTKALQFFDKIIDAYRKKIPGFIRVKIFAIVFKIWKEFLKQYLKHAGYKPVKDFQRQRKKKALTQSV